MGETDYPDHQHPKAYIATVEDFDILAVVITPQAKVELTIDEVKHFHGNQ